MANTKRKANLLLQDGSIFSGIAFGAEDAAAGEVVFNTGMVGYLESMTDPSYQGQILTFTYPLIGNYGVPAQSAKDALGLPLQRESDSIKVKGVVVYEACENPSHYTSARTLSKWMEDEGIPGIAGVDTRALVTKLREYGVMMGVLSTRDEGAEALKAKLDRAPKYDALNLVDEVSVRKPVIYGDGKMTVALLDCGAKYGLVRNLLRRGYRVARLPFESSYADVMAQEPAGVLVSNGPGDPALCTKTVETAGRLVDAEVPLLGVCLGEQILGLSQGAATFKLKYGHRGQNKPCVDLTTGRGYVTSQNHGYALEEKTLKKTELSPWFINSDDLTVEGVIHKSKPCMAVQFHPEASPGPYDTEWVFDKFTALMQRGRPVRGEVIRRKK